MKLLVLSMIAACGSGKEPSAGSAVAPAGSAGSAITPPIVSAPVPVTPPDASGPADPVLIKLIEKAIGDIDPVVVLDPCTTSNVPTTQPMEAVDQPYFMTKLPPGSDAAWEWLNTPMVAEIKAGTVDAAKLNEVSPYLVYVADEHKRPAGGKPGIFKGWLYVYDRKLNKPTCALPLAAEGATLDALKQHMRDKTRETLEHAGLASAMPTYTP